jgi:hypothetical protein
MNKLKKFLKRLLFGVEQIPVKQVTEEELQEEFRKIIKENPDNYDQDYLDQLKLEVILVLREELMTEIEWNIHNFEYHRTHKESFSTSSKTAKDIIKTLYLKIRLDSDLLRKDPETRRIIDLVDAEIREKAKEIDDKKRKEFWGVDRLKISKQESLGDCHIFWSDKKRILKEKYNIDWQSMQDRFPDGKFD